MEVVNLVASARFCMGRRGAYCVWPRLGVAPMKFFKLDLNSPSLIAPCDCDKCKGVKMRCKQDMIDAGEKMVPRTCPVHGIQRCRPVALPNLIDFAKQGAPVLSDMLTDAKYVAPAHLSGKLIAELMENAVKPGAILGGIDYAAPPRLRKRIYLAGKMRGVPNFNKPLFDAVTNLLRLMGNEVFSPVEHTESIYGKHVFENNPPISNTSASALTR
jgi:hypothetical protein